MVNSTGDEALGKNRHYDCCYCEQETTSGECIGKKNWLFLLGAILVDMRTQT